MDTENAVIVLPGKGNYAITLPGQITFVLRATPQELLEVKSGLLQEYVPEESVISTPRASLAVIPTFDCNLRCIYCYAKGGESKEVVKLKYVRRALKYQREKNPNAQWLDLYLVGGGEPLLHFELVKEIFALAKCFSKEVQIHIVTNGTFKENVANWLIEKEVDIRISYDGVAQSFQRPFSDGKESVNDVERTIKYLVASNIEPTLQMIVTSRSINQMIESALKAIEMGIKVVKVEPALSSEVSRGGKSVEPNPVSYARKLLELIRYVAQHKLPLKIDTGFFTKPATGFYCGMANENFTLTPDGLITPCVEVARQFDPYMNKIGIGSVRQGSIALNNGNLLWLKSLSYKTQLGGCNNCELRMLCLGGCPMANIWRNGLPLKKSAYTCSIEHEFLPKLLLMIAKEPIIMDVVMENTILT